MGNNPVVYSSTTGHTHQMTESVVAGANDAEAEVRLRRAAERDPEEVIRPAERHDGTASDPSDLPPDEPPPESMFAWQARVASP